MSKIGIYYAYWTHDWDADFHPFIDKVAELGFDVLEVNAGTIAHMASEERQSLKAHADDKDIILSHCIGLPHQYDIASMDEAIREKRPYVERSVASMKKAIKAAEDNNVIFNMEVVNRFEQFLMNTCDEAIAYVEAVDSPNVKILLDTFHMNIEEDFIGEAIQKADDKLGHLHIGENNRMPPGYGHIPWTEVGAALRKINYQGYVVMEPFLMPGGEVGRDIKVFRDMSVGLELDDEAQKALMFIRGVLK